MATYGEIKSFLEAHNGDLEIGQFGLDWVEKKLDDWDEWERLDIQTGDITLDDDTANDSIHYEADTILQVLRDDARCRPFFEQLRKLTERPARKILTRELVEEWKHDPSLANVIRKEGTGRY